ncbi:hypothetical protein FHS16_003009 [Paenibacillus endophyticus]|uniref:Uncharacterized protein n=1 Tax=Paenibacillus endophyticus TaxID=1294268 RepID=A0A7W5GAN7_9BACL|nr:hypothetical protein [Paenibacillus endophyticus]
MVSPSFLYISRIETRRQRIATAVSPCTMLIFYRETLLYRITWMLSAVYA